MKQIFFNYNQFSKINLLIKIILFSSILFLKSCDFSVENKNLKKITDACEFVDIKLEIYQEINLFYDKYFEVENYKEVEMEDFSKLMKLWQKNDEINFQIGLNHLENEIKSCDSYLKIDSLEKKMHL